MKCITLSLQAEACVMSFSLAEQLPCLYFSFSEHKSLKNCKDFGVGMFCLYTTESTDFWVICVDVRVEYFHSHNLE